jgi:hypothetical protein
MQYLDIFTADLNMLFAAVLNNPVAALVAGAVLGTLIILVFTLFLQRRSSIKYERFQEETDRKYKSLQESLSQKIKNIATLEQICLEQKLELASAQEQIARLEEAARNAPILESKFEQQLRHIEALTDTIVSELHPNPLAAPQLESVTAVETRAPLTNEEVIDHLGTRLYQQLLNLHQQISDQTQLISAMQTELNATREAAAKPVITEPQPNVVRARIGDRILEPIQMRIDGIRQSIHEIPNQTRAKIDRLLIEPASQKVAEIKTGLHQIPELSSAQLNRIVLDPLNNFIHQVNQAAKRVPEYSHEKFNQLITRQLQELIGQLKMSSRSLSRETRENFARIVVRPLEKLLAEMKQVLASLPEQGRSQIKERVLEPAMQKLKAISETGKQSSIQGLKDAGNWVLESVTRGGTPASAT